METLESLSLFVGTGECNGRCNHCAGKVHRKYAPKEDGVVNENLFYETLNSSYEQGARHLSLSSSGEPTLSPESVTKTLKLVHDLREEKIEYSPITLYSNGIRIGEDKEFCDTYLRLWKTYGLTTIYLTVHDIDERENARIYNIEKYPNLETVIRRIQNADLNVRANIILSKDIMNSYEKFTTTVNYLNNLGVTSISAWPIRNMQDELDAESAIPESELGKIREWVKEQTLDIKIKLMDETSRTLYLSGKKLTLFPDGKLSGTWCT